MARALSLSRRKGSSWRFSVLPKDTSGHTVVEQEPGGSFYGTTPTCQVFAASPQLCSQQEPASRDSRDRALSPRPTCPACPRSEGPTGWTGLTHGGSLGPGRGTTGEGAAEQRGHATPSLSFTVLEGTAVNRRLAGSGAKQPSVWKKNGSNSIGGNCEGEREGREEAN